MYRETPGINLSRLGDSNSWRPLHLPKALSTNPRFTSALMLLSTATMNLHEWLVSNDLPGYSKSLVIGPGFVANLTKKFHKINK